MIRQYIRYKNRKLYCKTDSCYVTIPELVADVRSGNTVNVLCNSTKLDVTDLVLRQALASGAVNLTREKVLSLVRGEQ